MFKRRFKLLGKILLALVLLFVVFLLFERVRGRIALETYRRELIRKGEELTAQEIMAHRLKGENGLPEARAAYKRLKAGSVMPSHCPPAMRPNASGRAIVGFQLPSWTEDKATYQWEQLAVDLNANASALDEIRGALASPVLDNNLDLSQGLQMKFPMLSETKFLADWFRSECLLALHEGRPGAAVTPLVANIRLPKTLVEDRLAISELVRYAIASSARTVTWEATQSEGWQDGDLAQIQAAWMEQEFLGSLVRGLEGERAYMLSIYSAVRSSNDGAFDIIFGMEGFISMFGGDSGDPWWHDKLQRIPGYQSSREFLRRNIICRIWRFAWLDQDECQYLRQMQTLLEITREVVRSKSLVSVQPAVAGLEALQNHFGFYDHLRFPMQQTIFPLVRILEKAVRVESDRSLAISAIALKRNLLRHGKHPGSLGELVPEFLPAIPVDYMDGKPIKYQFNADGSFTLYSVGKDGKDDSGDLSLSPGVKSIHDLWRRRDYAWPAPATPEEVEQYRREADED